ncbi:unnamed protein product [Prunus armeniaca]|uniref:Secreted protein n=1 Tax=Prunus armeniaca TaxID=36596 RepID=A0A6J5V7M4_PRUAR|nr:unnamed protein product [Prunus armeniaca]
MVFFSNALVLLPCLIFLTRIGSTTMMIEHPQQPMLSILVIISFPGAPANNEPLLAHPPNLSTVPLLASPLNLLGSNPCFANLLLCPPPCLPFLVIILVPPSTMPILFSTLA